MECLGHMLETVAVMTEPLISGDQSHTEFGNFMGVPGKARGRFGIACVHIYDVQT